jgi:hypothetical protein
MKKLFFLMVIVAFFVASPLMAAQMQTFKSGSKLLNDCSPLLTQNKNTTELLFEASCLNYIKGVFDLHQTLVARSKIEPHICKPTEVDLGQIGRIIIKYLQANPEKLKVTASSLILPALSEAFPCPESQTEK